VKVVKGLRSVHSFDALLRLQEGHRLCDPAAIRSALLCSRRAGNPTPAARLACVSIAQAFAHLLQLR
jgi:hypothetical protein